MKHGLSACLPFGVDRKLGTSLVDQIVGGVTLAARNGVLSDGDTLPGIRKLAKILSVSEIAVRRAVKELCCQGVLQARPRVGLTVCAGGKRAWRGVVAGILPVHDAGMYYANVLESTIASALMEKGWVFARTEWPKVADKDKTDIMGTLKCFAPVMVVALFPTQAMMNALERSGVPFVQVWTRKPSRKACLVAKPCADAALAELVVTFSAHGVRKVLSVHQTVGGIDCDTALRHAGFSVRTTRIRPLADYAQPENVQRAAMEAFDKMLSKGPIAADAVVFNDDYLTAGALTAFDRHGVRIPEDIRLATTSNYGLGPIHFRALTRLEVNPVRHGREIAENLIKILDGADVPQQMKMEVTFEEGETA